MRLETETVRALAANQDATTPELCAALRVVRPLLEDLADTALRRASWIVRLIGGGLLRALLVALDGWMATQCEGESDAPGPV